jgi:hypothetical protein
MRNLLTTFVVSVALGNVATTAWGQQTSGQIGGMVRDSQQAAIVDAKVTIINRAQGTTREVNTRADGSFLFTPLQPADYDLLIEAAGFKRFERRDIKLFANDRIQLPDLVLEVGAVSETITVEGSVITLQTKSAERAGVVTGRQIVELATSGRNFLDTVRTIPGINFRGGGLGAIFTNGNRGNQNNLTLDGVNNVDTGSNGGTHTSVNLDAIAEFKVITNSQPAEFGRSAGAAINIVTKSGGQEFHGVGYWFHRHEQFNANNWRNNMENRSRQLERVNWFGYNIGGPVYIPGKLNTNKDKFFFFFAQEFQRQLIPNSLRNVTVPTELERQGDFSRSFEGDGSPVRILDPLNNRQPFPGMVIPQNRLHADGMKILNFYPLPNAAGRDPSFNYQTQVSEDFPIRQEIYRGDYNISDNWRLFSRFVQDTREQNKPYGQWNADYNIPFSRMNFGTPAWSFITNLTTVVNPTLTNEFIFGSSKNILNIDPVDDTFNRAPLGLGYQMPFPDADTLGLVQNWRFGGVPNGPFTGFNGTPFRNFNHIWEFTDNMSKIAGSHQLKAGMYVHYSQKDQTAFTSVNGNIWFDRDGQNPGDTNWAFANALLGNYQRVQQSNVVHNGMYRNYNIEWYFQDNWRVTSKLTLDLGMRFYWIQPQYDAAGLTSSFYPERYNTADAATLVQPFRNAEGSIVGRNPITGQTVPRALIGSIVESGGGFVNGLYANGMGLESDTAIPQGLLRNRGIHYAPRVGLAYSFMDKTVLRMGGGIFYDRFQGNPVFDMLPNPPSTVSPTFYYGNLDNLATAQGTFFPQNVRGFSMDGHVPTTYNWNISIQRELPQGIVFDIGYVASRSKHLLAIQDFNQTPFGSAWLPQNQDPTVANPTFDGRTTKQVNLYRPYLGFGQTRVTTFGGHSNFNSLQVSANRRMGHGLLFGVAYTWSRTLGIAGGDGDTLHPTSFAVADYGPLFFDIPHNLVFNYTWDVPKPARGGNFLDNALGRAIFNGWTVSGITSFVSGEPDNVSFSIAGVGGADVNRIYTGSETYGPRVAYTGRAILPKGDRALDRYLDTSVFRLPSIGSLGMDSGPRMVRRPGINNWDLSVFKNIPFWAEGRYLQLRCEMFNAWNHTQFSDFNRSAQFNQQGVLTNLPASQGGGGGRFGFGAITAARNPRIIQLAMKFYW